MEKIPFSEKFRVTSIAPVAEMTPLFSRTVADAEACETVVQIGLFFDGTGNNLLKDLPHRAHSNVARLSKAYLADRTAGSFSFYVPGLGTAFPLIDERSESTFGSAFGVGGKARILYALLSVFNAICRAAISKDFFRNDDIKALCRSGVLTVEDEIALGKFGLATSLIEGSTWLRRVFFEKELEKLKHILSSTKGASIKEGFVDIFGFSRGAAEARAFCHWLDEVMEDSKIAGIPFRIRFLGLMDTVSSVGVLGVVTDSVTGKTGGHADWAETRYLRILPKVENCLHFVAMHELRKNFPLDTIAMSDTSMPENCHEYAYPGTHSDIGGGYAPGELGNCVGTSEAEGDALKLSQITLNHMYECALVAGVPMSRHNTPVDENGNDWFVVSDTVRRDFNSFFEFSSTQPRLLSDWTLQYLVWRWRQRDNYVSLSHVSKAKGKHLRHLMDANVMFTRQATWIQQRGDLSRAKAYVERARSQSSFDANSSEYRQEELRELEPEAAEVFWRAAVENKNTPIPEELAEFFDKYVHDSVAGFREQLIESTGHWRYRRLFRGGSEPRLSDTNEDTASGKV